MAALVPEHPLVAARPLPAAVAVALPRPDVARAPARPVDVASREIAAPARARTRPDEEDVTRPAQIATTGWVTEASLLMQDLGQSTERLWSRDLWATTK